MIIVKNLYLSFTKEYFALHNISIKVEKGEKVCLFGDKDSGKTTLLRVLCKLETAFKGEIYFNDKSIKNIDFEKDFSVGYLPCTPVFMAKKTVLKNLKYVLEIRKIDKTTINNKIADAIKEFKLEGIINKKIIELSEFEKKIVSLCRLSLRKIDLFLIDNIFENLNENEVIIIKNHLENIIQNSTALIALTDENLAKELCQRAIKLKLGSIE